jgi:formate hydrogenlyase transcriptional activator
MSKTDQADFPFLHFNVDHIKDGLLWTDNSGIIVNSNSSTVVQLTGNVSHKDHLIFDLIRDARFPAWFKDVCDGHKTDSSFQFFADHNECTIRLLTSVSNSGSVFHCFLIQQTAGEHSPDEMLRIISEGTASVVGGDFFKSLAYFIIMSTGMRYAIVTECANLAKTRVRTLVYIERDNFLDNFEYDLTGTPCEIVMRGEDYFCSADLDTLFPREHGVKSYFAVPIYLSSGEVIGHIAIFDTIPMTISPQKLNVLKIFASRAGAEIERKRQDEVIRDNMARYKSIFEGSPIGLGEEDLSEIKKYVEEIKLKYKKGIADIFHDNPAEIDECYRRLRRLNANRAQLQLFEVAIPDEYFDYLATRFQPAQFKDVIITFDRGERIFEREIEIKTVKGTKRFLKAKRAVMPGSEKDWAKTILTCVDITEQKNAQEELRVALAEVKDLKEKLEAENIYLQHEIKLEHNFEEIVSQSSLFRKVLEKVQLVANTDATVLILGESGTGKELIARAIHSISKRSSRPLVKVNCAALPASLIESELFGHEKGAFTGAFAQKIGRFELADGGTIFLDEIGEMPLEIQAKLLRVLQEGEFERVGSSKTQKVDVRVIAATNRDLESSVKNKEFRADLFYRLNVFPIISPPLRERREDIPILVNHFCRKYGTKLGKKITSVSKEVLDTLMNYAWPGNIRELENVVERGLIISPGSVLESGEWLPVIKSKNEQPQEVREHLSAKSLDDIEREHIVEVMKSTNWKVRGENGAAKILNLNPTTLEARMKKLGIKKPS